MGGAPLRGFGRAVVFPAGRAAGFSPVSHPAAQVVLRPAADEPSPGYPQQGGQDEPHRQQAHHPGRHGLPPCSAQLRAGVRNQNQAHSRSPVPTS